MAEQELRKELDDIQVKLKMLTEKTPSGVGVGRVITGLLHQLDELALQVEAVKLSLQKLFPESKFLDLYEASYNDCKKKHEAKEHTETLDWFR